MVGHDEEREQYDQAVVYVHDGHFFARSDLFDAGVDEIVHFLLSNNNGCKMEFILEIFSPVVVIFVPVMEIFAPAMEIFVPAMAIFVPAMEIFVPVVEIFVPVVEFFLPVVEIFVPVMEISWSAVEIFWSVTGNLVQRRHSCVKEKFSSVISWLVTAILLSSAV